MSRYRAVSGPEADRAMQVMFRESASSPAPDEADDSARRVRVLRDYLASQATWLEGVWAAERDGHIRAACALIGHPGRTGTVVLPSWEVRVDASLRQDLLSLLRVMTDDLDPDGFHLIQAIVDPGADWRNGLLADAGFERLADLVYQEMPIGGMPGSPALPAGFGWRRYDASMGARLERLLGETYEGTLDCPGLNGMRRLADVVAGHRATGEFDPGYWLLLEESGRAIACVLLARMSYSGAMEVVYMGVVPAARGRGIGELLVAQAAHLAGQSGVEKLALTVDARNSPARRIYEGAGFGPVENRRAWVRGGSPVRD